MILAERVENKIEKLVLGDTGGFEDFALFRLDERGCVFLQQLDVGAENERERKICTIKLPAQPTAPALPGLMMDDAVFLLMI